MRTLDAVHLASVHYLKTARQSVELATYDERMSATAIALGLPLFPLDG